MEDTVIKNGLVVTPNGIIRGGLAVQQGKITAIDADTSLPKASENIDADGCYILPGLIDPHVHIGRKEFSDFKSQFITESTSAAIGGVTTFIGFVRYGEVLERRLDVYQEGKRVGENNSYIDFKFHSYLFTDEQLDEIPDLIKAGITSYKLFLNNTAETARSKGYKEINFDYVYKVMQVLKRFGPPAVLQAHCEQPDLFIQLSRELKEKGRNDFLAWSEARPSICETMHVFNMGLLSMYTGCPIYIVHVSSKESVEAIKYLRGKGIRLYAETCAHYLTLNRYTDMGVLARVEPPLRDDEDIAYLWRAVMDNTFDTIGSDHVPLMKQQKLDDGIWKGTGGIGGIGAILAIMMTEGYHKGKITIERIAKITSENAARIWGIYPQKGVLLPGSDADIVIVDPNSEWTLSADSLQSRSDYSVFEGKKVRGKAVKTFVRGKLVAADGKLVTHSPSGKFVYPVNIK